MKTQIVTKLKKKSNIDKTKKNLTDKTKPKNPKLWQKSRT